MFGIFHAFESPAEDTGEPDKVQGRHWNEPHIMGLGSLFALGVVRISLSANGDVGVSRQSARIESVERDGNDVRISIDTSSIPCPLYSVVKVIPIDVLHGSGIRVAMGGSGGEDWTLSVMDDAGVVLSAPPFDIELTITFMAEIREMES